MLCLWKQSVTTTRICIFTQWLPTQNILNYWPSIVWALRWFHCGLSTSIFHKPLLLSLSKPIKCRRTYNLDDYKKMKRSNMLFSHTSSDTLGPRVGINYSCHCGIPTHIMQTNGGIKNSLKLIWEPLCVERPWLLNASPSYMWQTAHVIDSAGSAQLGI